MHVGVILCFVKEKKTTGILIWVHLGTEQEVTRERPTRVGRPRGGMKVAARSGERLRKEIRRGRLPRVGDG